MTHPAEHPNFACTDCGARSRDERDCSCGGGVLVDLSRPEFREMAIEADDRRSESHKQRVLWMSVGAGILGGVFMLGVGPLRDAIIAIPLPVPFANPIKFLGLMIGLTVVSSKIVERAWPAPRHFPELVAGRVAVALPSRMRAPKRATIIALVAFVALGVVINLGYPYVKSYIAKEEYSHRKEVDKKLEALDECVKENNPTGSSKDDDWTSECKRPVQSLYDALDGRSEDFDLKTTLEGEFQCKDGCKAAPLNKQYSYIVKGAFARGVRLSSTRASRASSPDFPASTETDLGGLGRRGTYGSMD